MRARTQAVRSGVIINVIRSPEDYQRFLQNHVDSAHRGEILADCPACQELKKKAAA